MSPRHTLFAFLAIAAFSSFSACSCGDDDGNPPNGPDDDTEEDAGYQGCITDCDGPQDGGPGSVCLATGQACDADGGSGGVCCSGVCQGGTCTEPVFCKGPAATCTSSTECCSNRCLNGVCSNQQCLDIGASCTVAADCCTSTCTGGVCAAITAKAGVGGTVGSCEVLGQACGASSECCSQNCQGGVCVRAYTCQANGDVCTRDTDCCGGACSSNDGVTGGYCMVLTGGGGTGCATDGNPCESGTNCCSRTCTDLGSGVKVCVPANGCKVTGNYCASDSQCCGANDISKVTCDNKRCDNGTKCAPPGNICGAPVLRDGGSVNAEQNCCNGSQLGGKDFCRLDSQDVPRCFGLNDDTLKNDCPTGYTGTAPCCVAAGDVCAFKDQCCNGLPCVPDNAGVLRCTANSCKPTGEQCTPGAGDCCSPAQCLGSELNYACQLPSGGTTLPDGGTSGTTPDGGFCKPNGPASTCSSAAECCSKVCAAPSGGGQAYCQAPGACQPQGGACSNSADCCNGLGCVNGSCQVTQTQCAQGGQSCSTANPCCTNLLCLDNNGNNCTDTATCLCRSIIN